MSSSLGAMTGNAIAAITTAATRQPCELAQLISASKAFETGKSEQETRSQPLYDVGFGITR
jgi:hypothetical protein